MKSGILAMSASVGGRTALFHVDPKTGAMKEVISGRRAIRGFAYDARPESSVPRDLGFEFRFYRGPDTDGWYADVHGDDAYTIANVRLDVVPVKVAQPPYKPLQNPQP
jgi:cyanophycinase